MRIDSICYGQLAGWTSTGDSAAIAPLAQLPGNGRFIVEFPAYGAKIGRLIINPIPDDEKGFTAPPTPKYRPVTYGENGSPSRSRHHEDQRWF